MSAGPRLLPVSRSASGRWPVARGASGGRPVEPGGRRSRGAVLRHLALLRCSERRRLRCRVEKRRRRRHRRGSGRYGLPLRRGAEGRRRRGGEWILLLWRRGRAGIRYRPMPRHRRRRRGRWRRDGGTWRRRWLAWTRATLVGLSCRGRGGNVAWRDDLSLVEVECRRRRGHDFCRHPGLRPGGGSVWYVTRGDDAGLIWVGVSRDRDIPRSRILRGHSLSVPHVKWSKQARRYVTSYLGTVGAPVLRSVSWPAPQKSPSAEKA